MDRFEFESCCTENELEDRTIEMLKERGYKSYKSLRLLSEASITKQCKDLIPGQLALLREGVSILRPDTQTTASSTASTSNDTTATASHATSMPPTTEGNTIGLNAVRALCTTAMGLEQEWCGYCFSALLVIVTFLRITFTGVCLKVTG